MMLEAVNAYLKLMQEPVYFLGVTGRMAIAIEEKAVKIAMITGENTKAILERVSAIASAQARTSTDMYEDIFYAMLERELIKRLRGE